MTQKKTDELAATDELLKLVREERASHLAKWGEQTHPSYQGEGARRTYERTADYYKQIWDANYQLGTVTWDIVLLEEVFEALCELDPEARKAELIQVAAVALAEAESIELRAGKLLDEVDLDGAPPIDAGVGNVEVEGEESK